MKIIIESEDGKINLNTRKNVVFKVECIQGNIRNHYYLTAANIVGLLLSKTSVHSEVHNPNGEDKPTTIFNILTNDMDVTKIPY